MNKVLRRIARKVLLIPIVKRYLEEICEFYAMPQLAAIQKRLDMTEAFIKSRAKALENQSELDLEEALSVGDVKALEKLVAMVIKDKIMIVEVGSWKGMSTGVLAKAVADYNGQVFAVDHWRGNEGTWNYDIAKAYDVYCLFRENMILLGLWDIIHPLVMDSQTASQIFADGILDLVFIDADHRYEYIKRDIAAWLPKLKEGGILSGHDCEGYYSEYPEEVRRMIDEHLGDDTIPNLCHPGVVKALYEYFGKNYSIMPNSTIWYYIKNK